VLAAAPALIALGTATASHAETNSTSPPGRGSDNFSNYPPTNQTPYGTYQNDHKRGGHH
jgi:hypothetical protein